MTSRRTVLKAGLIGGALLAIGGTAALITGRDPARDRDDVLLAVIPAILDGALPAAGPEREGAIAGALADSRQALAGLAPQTQHELAQLFALLSIAPLRRLMTGVPVDLPRASVPEVAAFLDAWRRHRLGLLQAAYRGLHELVTGPWYAQPSHWAAIGYAGPIRL